MTRYSVCRQMISEELYSQLFHLLGLISYLSVPTAYLWAIWSYAHVLRPPPSSQTKEFNCALSTDYCPIVLTLITNMCLKWLVVRCRKTRLIMRLEPLHVIYQSTRIKRTFKKEIQEHAAEADREIESCWALTPSSATEVWCSGVPELNLNQSEVSNINS